MPRWKELKRFCERDGWELHKDTDHYFFLIKRYKYIVEGITMEATPWRCLLKYIYRSFISFSGQYRSTALPSISSSETKVFSQ